MGAIGIRRWILRGGAALAMGFTLAACATTTYQPPPPPPPPVPAPVVEVPAKVRPAPQYGVASWYGPGFNGHRTSTGEIYNQNDLTAASMIYPLGSHVMVTNLNTGRSVEVLINDHGPLKKGRKIDLSHKAATMIGMLDKGTAHVKIELLSAPPGSRAAGTQPRFYVQVGSFNSSEHAHELRNQLKQYYDDVRIEEVGAESNHYYRVRMGPFETRSAAQARANQAAKIGYPLIVSD
ncbi:MAG TPA: septal ring lytic transglycosylase RlpA family protein [Candidatus Binataceae bacterium]|nr:septal ring lytic transglycosylase RlpA family protein [Candidatus Binataceae bacterium]